MRNFKKWNWKRIGNIGLGAILVIVLLLSGMQLNIVKQDNELPKLVLTVGNPVDAFTGTVDFTGLTDVQVQQALDALPATGGQVQLISPAYTFSNTVSRAINNVLITGVNGTTITYAGACFSVGAQTGWKFQDIRIAVGGSITNFNTAQLQNVTIGATYYASRLADGTGYSATGTSTFGNINDSGLTNGQSVYAGASGLLSSEAGYEYNAGTNTLSVPTLSSTTVGATTLNAPTGRGATYVIAASDATATEKSQADVVCDGINDNLDIQNVHNLLANGGTILFTSGNYYFGQAVTVTNDDIKFIGTNATTFNMSNANHSTFVSALAGQRDIVVASSSGFIIGHTIAVTDANWVGVYDITNVVGNTITVQDNLTQNFANGSVWDLYAMFRVLADNTTFDNFSVEGNRANRLAGRAGGMFPAGAAYETWTGTAFPEEDACIFIGYTVSVDTITIKNCNFDNMPQMGVLYYTPAPLVTNNFTVQNCKFTDIGDGAINGYGVGNGFLIEGNYINGTAKAESDTPDTATYGDGIQFEAVGINTTRVMNNLLIDIGRTGINAQYNGTSTANHRIIGNTILDFGVAVEVGAGVAYGIQAYNNSTIIGNYIDGVSVKAGTWTKYCGIAFIDAYQGVISGNTIKNVKSTVATYHNGIYIEHPRGVDCSNNTIYNTAGIVLTQSGYNIVLSGNTIDVATSGSAWSFAFAGASTYNTVSVQNNTGYGAITEYIWLESAIMQKLSVSDNVVPDTVTSILYKNAGATVDNVSIVQNNQGYINKGEIRSSSGLLTAGNANVIAFAWHSPEFEDIYIKKVVVTVTTGGGTAGSHLDVGIADDTTGTNRGTEFFNDLLLENVSVNDSLVAATGGTQTVWVFCQDSASATDGWIVGQILDANAASLVGSYYIEYVGK